MKDYKENVHLEEKEELAKEEVSLYVKDCGLLKFKCVTDCILNTCWQLVAIKITEI